MEITYLINKFIDSIRPDDRILILTHDNPDPDSISSAAALRHIIAIKTKKRATVGYGGIIGRAENQEMANQLSFKLVPLRDINLDDFDVVALVDCQPEAGNSPVFKQKRTVAISIDHHPKHSEEVNADFVYLNDTVGATCSILTIYLMENQISIPKDLATALFYGIKSETQNLVREAANTDRKAFNFLFPLIDNAVLGLIERPRRSRKHFQQLAAALDATYIYGKTLVTIIEDISVPDVVPQAADWLVVMDDIEWSLVIGVMDDLAYLSIRTTNPLYNAGKLIKQVVGNDGTCGGHGMMAGGRLEMLGKNKTELTAFIKELKQRFLEALKLNDIKGEKLVPRDPLRRSRKTKTIATK